MLTKLLERAPRHTASREWSCRHRQASVPNSDIIICRMKTPDARQLLDGLPDDLTLLFFATFARFEYALKQRNFLRSKKVLEETFSGRSNPTKIEPVSIMKLTHLAQELKNYSQQEIRGLTYPGKARHPE